MCGRFALATTPQAFSARFGCPPPSGWTPRWNIAPQSRIVVVHARGGERRAVWMHWGFRPSWARAARDMRPQINARIETVSERPMFRDAFRRRRALVPVSGFYEWQKPPRGPSRPFFIAAAGGELLALAALFATPAGEEEATVAILTRPASEALQPIHHRMPLILPEKAWKRWLDPEPVDDALLQHLLEEAETVHLHAVPVSRRVNDPRQDDPSLLTPIEEEQPPVSEESQGRLW